MSLLRITLRLIVGVDIHIDYADSGVGVIRCCPPLTAQQFDLTQFFQRSASPVCLRSRRTRATLALATVLITEQSQPALAIASQPMWTEQTGKTVVNGRNRSALSTASYTARYRGPNCPALPPPGLLTVPDYLRHKLSGIKSAFYNTVILAGGSWPW